MSSNKKFFSQIYSELVLVSIMFLFFLQLCSDFLEAIYALNLIEVELNENVLALLFFLSPAVLFLFRKSFPDKLMVIIGEVMIVCRVVEVMLEVQFKMIISGLGVGCFLIFFPVFLQKKDLSNQENDSKTLGLGLGFAIVSSIFFRTLGTGLDISTYSWFQCIGWLLAIISAIMIINLLNKGRDTKIEETLINEKPASTWKVLGLTLGLISIFILIYFSFSSPTVISRWTEFDYVAILAILIIMIALFTIFTLFKPEIFVKIKLWTILVWHGLFALTLVLTVYGHQTSFPPVEGAYPVVVPPTNIIQRLPVILMLIFSPIILIDFMLLSRELIKSRPSTWKIGGSFIIASGYFIIMILSAVFTIVSDYIPLVGPFFRDMIWFVFLIIGIIIVLPVLLIKKSSLIFKKAINSMKLKITITVILGIINIGTIVSAIITEPYSIEQATTGNSIKVLSYNIQQGINEQANKDFYSQFEVIIQAYPDIIGLQESDTCRISSGNTDIVRFMNSKLKMYSYFGPKTVTGTFGLALLSKYPIENAMTFYMYSEGGEQTATIQAEITVGTTTFNIFITHLGNYVNTSVSRAQIIQQENIISRIEGKSNVILMGDFNFIPNTEQYNITTAILNDCWEVADNSILGTLPTSWIPRLPAERIDHVFVSPGTTVSSCRYFGGTASDHPAIMVEIQL